MPRTKAKAKNLAETPPEGRVDVLAYKLVERLASNNGLGPLFGFIAPYVEDMVRQNLPSKRLEERQIKALRNAIRGGRLD